MKAHRQWQQLDIVRNNLRRRRHAQCGRQARQSGRRQSGTGNEQQVQAWVKPTGGTLNQKQVAAPGSMALWAIFPSKRVITEGQTPDRDYQNEVLIC